MIRLYGHLRGSFRTVTEGLELAFRELGVLEGTFYGETPEFDEVSAGGAFAPIAVVTGDPLRVLQAHYHGQHKKKFLLLAPNSNGVQRSLVRQLKEPLKLPTGEKVPTVDGFLAPSKWAREVLQESFPDHPVIYCPHGVMPAFRKNEELRAAALRNLQGGSFRILHVTSSRLSRKCTRELIAAWEMFLSDKDPLGFRLDISVNPEFLQEYASLPTPGTVAGDTVGIYPGQNFRIDDFVKTVQSYNFVVQPSRAEGFGLVPLEARACGVPAIATDNTGHLDHHFGPGTIPVLSGLVTDSDDYLGATAPSVQVESILASLEGAYASAVELHEEAMSQADIVADKWAWSKLTEPALKEMQEI